MSTVFGVDQMTGKTKPQYWHVLGWTGAVGCVVNIGMAVAILLG